jgi:mannose-6-phosphate isomerase-like protein (cupin superfamily)
MAISPPRHWENLLRRPGVTTEVYFILEGCSEMEFNCDVVDVEPGTTILIPPGTRHRLTGQGGQPVRTVVFALPAFRADDDSLEEGFTTEAQRPQSRKRPRRR